MGLAEPLCEDDCAGFRCFAVHGTAALSRIYIAPEVWRSNLWCGCLPALNSPGMANRIVNVETECPRCLRRYWDRVEVHDEDPENAGKGTVRCPLCGNETPESDFVGYGDDVWRVSGANPAFP